MKTTIDELIEQTVTDLDQQAIVPADFETELRQQIEKAMGKAKVSTFEELNADQVSELKKYIRLRKKEVVAIDPFSVLHTRAYYENKDRRLGIAFMTPTVGSLLTLAALYFVSNR